MSKIRYCSIFLALILVFFNQTSYANNCAMPVEKQALDVRALQTQLMVAAISCDQHSKYNAVMTKFNRSFAVIGNVMKSYFSRNYHKNSEEKMNGFITTIANESSKISLKQNEKLFCKTSDRLFDQVLVGSPKDLFYLASSGGFGSIHNIKSCAGKSHHLASAK